MLRMECRQGNAEIFTGKVASQDRREHSLGKAAWSIKGVVSRHSDMFGFCGRASEHAKLIFTEKVLHHLRKRATWKTSETWKGQELY